MLIISDSGYHSYLTIFSDSQQDLRITKIHTDTECGTQGKQKLVYIVADMNAVQYHSTLYGPTSLLGKQRQVFICGSVKLIWIKRLWKSLLLFMFSFFWISFHLLLLDGYRQMHTINNTVSLIKVIEIYTLAICFVDESSKGHPLTLVVYIYQVVQKKIAQLSISHKFESRLHSHMKLCTRQFQHI